MCDYNKNISGPTRADIIIVGAGTAGAVLANRLSKKYSVIVLEEGLNQINNPLLADPLKAGSLVLDYTNNFFCPLGHAITNPVPDNKRFPMVAGETFGGGSAVNGMQYVRSPDDYYARLEQLTGDKAWGPESANRIYKNMETFNGVTSEYAVNVHGTDGPVDIRQCTRNKEAAIRMQNALFGLGYPKISDYNNPATPVGGFVYWQLFQQPDKVRESSATAYLEDIIHEKVPNNVYVGNKNRNLTIYSKAHVLKVTFDKYDKKNVANGVDVVINNERVTIHADKRVIICAGFQSSLLLQLSGIGDKAYLKSIGVNVIYDNPEVGKHILNHPIITLTGTGNVPSTAFPDPEALYAGGAEIPDESTPLDRSRHVQFIGIDTPNADPTKGAFTVVSVILQAESEGNLSIDNSDAIRMPRFETDYFSNAADINTAVATYGVMHDTLVGMGLTPLGPAKAASLNPVDPTYIAVKDYVFRTYGQAYHWTGACSMTTTDRKGVVDRNGSVIGTKNLTVADITILPTSPKGNCAAPAFLIGNVISEKILNTHRH